MHAMVGDIKCTLWREHKNARYGGNIKMHAMVGDKKCTLWSGI